MLRLQDTWHLNLFTSFENVHPIYKITNVQEFWQVFNNAPEPSSFSKFANYSLFKNNMEMSWENETNKEGGRWIISIDSKFSVPGKPTLSANAPSNLAIVKLAGKRKLIDVLWESVAMLLVGNNYEDTNQLIGAVVNARQNVHRINIWTNLNDLTQLKKQGKWIRKTLRLPKIISMEYKKHSDIQGAASTYSTQSLLSC